MTTESNEEPKTPEALFIAISDEIEKMPGSDKEVSAILKKHFLKSPLEKNAVTTALQALSDLAKIRAEEKISELADHN